MGKKGILAPKRPKIGRFGPKHLQKSSYGFKRINYGLQKGPFWAKKGIFKPPKRFKIGCFYPKHLQKISYGFEMINYGPK